MKWTNTCSQGNFRTVYTTILTKLHTMRSLKVLFFLVSRNSNCTLHTHANCTVHARTHARTHTHTCHLYPYAINAIVSQLIPIHRYEVVIDVPPTISEEEAARGVTGKIHGLYTYGEKVVGRAKLELWKESDLNPQPSFGGKC